MSSAWQLIGLIGCALLFCPLKWLFRPALLVRQVLWTVIISAGHLLGQSLRLLCFIAAIGLSLPLLFSALPNLLTTELPPAHLWTYAWVVTVIIMRLALLPALLIDWSSIRPWEQEIARRAYSPSSHEYAESWRRAFAEVKSTLPRVWKISYEISYTRSHDFYREWEAAARCSGLLLLHLFLRSAATQLKSMAYLANPYWINYIFLLIIVSYLIKLSLSNFQNTIARLAHLSLLASIVYFSYTFIDTHNSSQASGISVFIIISILTASLAVQQMVRFFIQADDVHANFAPFRSGQWQFGLINQFAKLGKIAMKRSNIFIFLHLLDVLAAILRITVT